MATIANHYGLHSHPDIPVGSRAFYAGCEFEIEDCKNAKDMGGKTFLVEIDHSLRNNGYEFKTRPAVREECEHQFQLLHANLKTGKDAYTERTSIHVHVNVANLELQQVRQLVLTYALLEPLFLEYVGPVRKNSIFCVPLNYTYIPSTYKMPIDKMWEKWHKYTALNIKPLASSQDSPGLGTIEFRHMYGTNDARVFNTWVKILEELYTFVETRPELDIIQLIEAGHTPAIFAKIVVPTLAALYSPFAINEMCKDTLLDVKLSVGGLK
jgi:hypothetical protein